MRVVVVTTSYPRSADDPSGHFVRAHALALRRGGDEVHVLAPGGSLGDPPRFDDGVQVYPVGGGALFGWPGALARARQAPWRLAYAGSFALGVRRRLGALGPLDRAVAHWILPSAWPLLAVTRAPLEVHAHGADVRLLGALPAPLRRRVIAHLLRREARFVFAAQALLEDLALTVDALGPSLRAASHVSPPPIDLPDVTEETARRRAELEPGARLIVTAGRLIASKRAELAIDAAALLGPSTRLVLVGDGPEREALEVRARARGVLARFTGTLPRPSALAWIAAADALVHPSAVEAAPTVVREARSLGVPVIACAAGDVAAWAVSDPGIVVVRPSATAIAEQVARAVNAQRLGG